MTKLLSGGSKPPSLDSRARGSWLAHHSVSPQTALLEAGGSVGASSHSATYISWVLTSHVSGQPMWESGEPQKCIRFILAPEAPRLARQKDEDTVTNRLACQCKLPWAPEKARGKPRPRVATGWEPTGGCDESRGHLMGQNSSLRPCCPHEMRARRPAPRGHPNLGNPTMNLGNEAGDLPTSCLGLVLPRAAP